MGKGKRGKKKKIRKGFKKKIPQVKLKKRINRIISKERNQTKEKGLLY